MDDQSHGSASIREVIALVEGARRDLAAEVEKLEARLAAEVEKLGIRIDVRFEVHQNDHQREQDRRTGYLRWAVTSILTGLGVVVAIYASLRGG